MSSGDPGGSSPKSRSKWINLALAATAFGLLGLAVWMNKKPLQEVFSRPIDARLFVLGFGIFMTAMLVTFVRWYFLVRALGLPFRLADAMRLGFIGNVYNLVIPGAVSGDLIKAVFLCREHPDRKAQAVASMFIDRVVGLLGLFLLASGAGATAWKGAEGGERTLIALVWAAAATGSVGLLILFTPSLYSPLRRLVRGGRGEALLDQLVSTASTYRSKPGVVLLAIAMSILNFTLMTLAFYCSDRALFSAEAPSLAGHLLMVPLLLFTTAVPLPFGALGVTEAAGGGLLKLVGHPAGAVAVMGFRVLMYAGGLVSALVYAVNARQVRSLSEPDPGESKSVAISDRAV